MDEVEVIETYEILSRTYRTMDDGASEWRDTGLFDSPFKTLVTAALSTMTSSKRLVAASLALFEKVSDFDDLAGIEDAELTRLIKPVAHYNRKTQSLKKMSQQVLEQHQGEVPRTRDELMALPGIGRKCADIVLNFNFGEPTIAVDTHVRRLANRLGLVHQATAVGTADELMKITPDRYVRPAHEWLVQHGMTICIARTPKCGKCVLAHLCAYNNTASQNG